MAHNKSHTIKPKGEVTEMKATNWTINHLSNGGTVISESLTETPSMFTRVLSLTANKIAHQVICHSQAASLNCLALLASDRMTGLLDKYKVTATFDRDKFFLSIVNLDDILSHPFPAPIVTEEEQLPVVTGKKRKAKK
jgi:hypothetical protein